VNRKLSITVGVRFSHFVPTYTSANNIANFVPALYDPAKAVTVTPPGLIVPNSGNMYNGLIRAGDGVPPDQAGRAPIVNPGAAAVIPTGAPRGLYPSYNLAMPNFGFAYNIFGNGKGALRGGYRTSHDRVEGNLIFSQVSIAPFSNSVSYESGSLSNPAGGTTSAVGVMGGINSIDSHLKIPVVYDYNLSVERELPKGTFLRLAYAGKQLRHLLRQPPNRRHQLRTGGNVLGPFHHEHVSHRLSPSLS